MFTNAILAKALLESSGVVKKDEAEKLIRDALKENNESFSLEVDEDGYLILKQKDI